VPRVNENYRSARKNDLFRATWTCIVRQGSDKTSISDIIAESGFSAGMVYNYFAGKDELVAAAFAEAVRRLEEAVDTATRKPAPTPEKLLSLMVRAIALRPGSGDNAMAALWPLALSASPAQLEASGLRAANERILDRVRAQAERWREQGVIGRAGSARGDAEALIAQLFGFVIQQGLAQAGGSPQGWAPALLALRRQTTALRNLREGPTADRPLGE
jgi:AcrR family transcriptional regulator